MSEDTLKSLTDSINTKIDAFRAEVDSVKGSVTGLDAVKFAKMEGDLAKAFAEKTALENRVSAMEAAKSRPDFKAQEAEKADELKSLADAWMRKGTDSAKEKYVTEVYKSVNITAPEAGGVLVEPVLGKTILTELAATSAIRNIANVITVGNEQYINAIGGSVESGWAGELDVRAETAGPDFSREGLKFGEIYANIKVSNHALNDVNFDLEGYITQAVLQEFRDKENIAFISGNGVNKPLGFATSADVQLINTGNAATFGTAPVDALLAALYDLKVGYRNNASFLMNARSVASLAAAKDTTGRYILTDAAAGVPAKLLGRPVYEDEAMASVAANSVPVFVGDFKRGYTVADIQGSMTMIREPYTAKGFTMFYIARRVGGGVTMAEAIRGIRVATNA